MSKENRFNRVKNPEEIIIPKGFILVEVIEKEKPLIISPDLTDNDYKIDYMFVRKIAGDTVTQLEELDVILEFDSFNVSSFRSNEKLFSVMPVNNVRIAVKPENFTFTKKTNLN